jgi:hypothetical protein
MVAVRFILDSKAPSLVNFSGWCIIRAIKPYKRLIDDLIQRSYLDFIQLRRIAERFSEAFEQGTRDF